ncbi:NAD-dependent epimerase/dehydratase family protein [Candidatus Woesebacteria bacterium]|nr:NAD-dependent epimerase/dehydratase family protein [Candidatus Woesebacteria bacterium]
MKKTALITGGAGFIGSHTADALLKKGYNVRILDAFTKPVHQYGIPGYLANEIEVLRGDVRKRKNIYEALKGADVVFHFAAFQDYLPVFSRYFDVNATGTALLYELIVKHNLPIQKLILASSQAVYGEGTYRCNNGHTVCPSQRSIKSLKKHQWDFVCPHDGLALKPQWTNEEAKRVPHNSYGISKVAQESIALNLGKRYSIPTVALRYSIVQGPRQSPFNLYSGVLRVFVTHLLAGTSPTIYEDGKQLRDFINIYDVVKANILVLEDARADYQIFNVGSGKTWTVRSFFDIVQKQLNSDIPPKIDKTFRVGDTRHIFSDINKIKKLGFAPFRRIEESIGEYAKWVQTLPHFDKLITSLGKT